MSNIKVKVISCNNPFLEQEISHFLSSKSNNLEIIKISQLVIIPETMGGYAKILTTIFYTE